MVVKMYRVEGMNCGGCLSAVKSAIKSVPGVIEAQVQLSEPEAIISMENDISQDVFQQAVSAAGRYAIAEMEEPNGKKGPHEKKKGKGLSFLSPKKECCK